MSTGPRPPTSDWSVFKLLWKSARKRNAARSQRQGEILNNRGGSKSNPLGRLATAMMIGLSCLVHGILGWNVVDSLKTAQIVAIEKEGRFVVPDVSTRNLDRLRELESRSGKSPSGEELLDEAKKLARSADYDRSRRTGRSYDEEQEAILAQVKAYGSSGFVSEKDVVSGLLAKPGQAPMNVWILPSFVLLWWGAMLIAQGEGLEMDVQRRRHPIWEWLFSHPVRPVAAFSAEMFSPLMANPIYFAAPIFWFMIFREFQPLVLAGFTSLLVGLPIAVAASCASKAIEIAAMLRLSERTRGAVLGLLSWIGYVAMMIPLFTIQLQSAKESLAKVLEPLAAIPLFTWPAHFAIVWSAGDHWWGTVLVAWLFSGCLIGCAAVLSWRGVAKGLQGQGARKTVVRKSKSDYFVSSRFSSPLYLKELLWLWRDKAAVIQVVLIPLTIGLFQAFNLRGIAVMAGSQWNILCGFAILCGTYFLLVIGPRSLNSEGGALWISLTWPQGLEDLLKAKALLWWRFSMVIVGLALVWGMFRFPADWWRIALVGVGWWFFGRALAEKSVSLVTAPSSSGEQEKPPLGRRFAAMIGTFAFGAGVMTQNWHLAILGVVFASLTAAAMWQNLRARLPYLFDPWSERLPPAPTLLHAMIAIAILSEVVGSVVAAATVLGGAEQVWLARSISYAVVGLMAFAGMINFLEDRGVTQKQVWKWPIENQISSWWKSCLLAIACGAALGGGALLYLGLLQMLPATSEHMSRLAELAREYADGLVWQIILTVGLVPVAEEFLFRGVLYRALDREWGGWRAMVGSAAYFAIYHPPLSWIPVFLLGLCCAALFKKTGRLWVCVFCHAAYNLIVVLPGH